ncbi:MAG: NADH-quinone oxidoreductase subunit L [Acidimicrobiales bacterium]
MLDQIWVIPLIPAVSFWLVLGLGRRLRWRGAEIAVPAVAASFVLSCVAVVQWITRSPVGEGEGRLRPSIEHSLVWWRSSSGSLPAGSGGGAHPVSIRVGVHVDGLTVAMLAVVTLISLLVHVYSTEYLRDDRRYTHYFAALNLFTAGMLLLVVSSETLEMLFGWETMGLCSFMLIGHWWEERDNSNAALKAFLTTRTGDIGFLVGLSILFFANGQSFNIARLNHEALAGHINHPVLLLGAIALFAAAVGKSAQFPLHTWLPDAMAGPTPVSALIHAATMVVAGVYLVARLYGVFWAAFSIGVPGHGAFNLVAMIGGVTILIAAALAFVQDDIKKVLAYSTVSQLGYMIMALGVGAWTGAIFHLFTHAFFKACLFLGAGSVSHSGSHHSFDMRRDMGGLRKYMPITHATFLIATLALAGIFPFAGFWSKDEILVTAGHNGYTQFMIVGLIGAFMTAAYMARCVWLTFYGEYRGHGHPHESPPAITVPLVVLAVLSVGAGWLGGFGIHAFSQWTRNLTLVEAHVPEVKFSVPAAAVSVAIALTGLLIGWLFFEGRRARAAGGERGLHGLTTRSRLALTGYRLLVRKYYLDDLYTGVIASGTAGPVAEGTYWADQHVIDGAVNGVAAGARQAARITYDVIDQGIIDGAVNGTGLGAEGGGGVLRRAQTGQVQQYAAVLFGAAGLIALALVLFT